MVGSMSFGAIGPAPGQRGLGYFFGAPLCHRRAGLDHDLSLSRRLRFSRKPA
jgi:hypothetical protein